MASTIFITGGAASGKTRWAITYFQRFDNVLYLCTGGNIDPDILGRIKYKNNEFGIDWDIQEGVDNLVEKIDNHKFCILDSLGNYTDKVIKKICPNIEEITHEQELQIESTIIKDVMDLIDTVKDIDGNLIIISVETGFSVTPEDKQKRVFREILGTVNQRIANMSSEVYLSASGIQFKIK